MAAAPPTNPAEAFGAGDPRNAQYFQTLASLEHQYNTTLAGDKEKLASSRSNALYQQGLLGEKEPGSYKANEHRANAGGLLESGVNAERRGTIGQEYANKRFGVSHGLQETEGSITANEQSAKESLESGRANAANTALSEGYKALLEREPNDTAAASRAANPGGVRTVEGPAGPGGVVPYSEKTPGGSVKVGGVARPQIRATAANRYLTKSKGR
jgi:hypothetical protein